ncbi:MAG: hypothetical protein MJ179_02540 [Treponema sp.]|nr:hypothetical protein [Treponema sp.]
MKKIYEVLNGDNFVIDDYRTQEEAEAKIKELKELHYYSYLKVITIKR